jgi:hypothetical protein
MWAVCAALAALVSLALPLQTAAQVDPATGVVGTAPVSQGSPQEEPPGFAAMGVDPDDRAAAESDQPAEAVAPAEAQQDNVERSGVLVGHSAADDRPAEPTPAATGVGH